MNITTPNTSPFDRAVREASARSAALLRSNCTLREQSLIAFAPLVLIDIAFTYAGKCRNYAAKKRVLNLKPVCRAFDACTTRWQETIASALDYEHRNHIRHEAAERHEQRHDEGEARNTKRRNIRDCRNKATS